MSSRFHQIEGEAEAEKVQTTTEAELSNNHVTFQSNKDCIYEVSDAGAFLIPYMIMMLLIGFPVLILELAIGQYIRTTPLKLYGKAAPMFAGCIDHVYSSAHCNATEPVYAFGQCLSPSSHVSYPNGTQLMNADTGLPMIAQQVDDYRTKNENRQSSGIQYLYV
ncbi:unnamed protein product [Sphagnum balticum]